MNCCSGLLLWSNVVAGVGGGCLTFRWGAFIPSEVCCFWATSCFVNQSITVQSMQSQHLNFCMFSLLFLTACFGHSFDHHQVGEKKCLLCSIFPFCTCIISNWLWSNELLKHVVGSNKLNLQKFRCCDYMDWTVNEVCCVTMYTTLNKAGSLMSKSLPTCHSLSSSLLFTIHNIHS